MLKIDLPHAVERCLHQIAGQVHLMLWQTNTTVDELKAKLAKFPKPNVEPEVVDFILTATNGDKVKCSDLANIAFAMECEWDFRVVKIPLEDALEQASAEENA